MPRALILSVGMSVGSETFAIKNLEPDYVAFVCTPDSRSKIDDIIEQTGLKASKIQIYEIPDDYGQLGELVSKAHQAFRWAENKLGSEGQVVVNPTAGRKWMSHGLSLFAGQTDAKIVYVDADFESGKPRTGTERLVDLGNPDDATGMLAAKTPVALFNRGDFEGAAEGFAKIKPNRATPKVLYESLQGISGALTKWERFEHYSDDKVHKALEEARANALNAAKELDMVGVASWAEEVKDLASKIKEVCESKKPSLLAVADLYANAARKREQGRHEDAGARLYRALEAVAQWMLDQKGINPSKVDWNPIPDEAKERFKGLRRDRNAPLPGKLGLTDAFALARSLGCHHAEAFFENEVFALRKQIETRNQSILAHGWIPATATKIKDFQKAVGDRLRDLGADLEGWTVPKLPNLWQ